MCGKCGATRVDSQLGLEPTPEEYVANMVAVFREVRRVLRSDGTCWVNLGDSYNTSPPGNKPNTTALSSGLPNSIANQEMRRSAQAGIDKTKATGLKPKDLVGIPWRVAFALQADGWYLRSDIIWSKPNPMPESVTDRPTKAHEYLFLLSKSPRYYYDADAVREPHADPNVVDGVYQNPKAVARPGYVANTQGWVGNDGKPGGLVTTHRDYNPAGRNLRSVWSIATQPYPGAHFATFPEKLVEPCVKAGTSERGVCPECGAPWRRVVERVTVREQSPLLVGKQSRSVVPTGGGGTRANSSLSVSHSNPSTPIIASTGWQRSCDHGPTLTMAETAVPATVLDPFAGSGTTGRVAQRLGRRAVLIDLSGEYLTQAMKRNHEIPLGLEAV